MLVDTSRNPRAEQGCLRGHRGSCRAQQASKARCSKREEYLAARKALLPFPRISGCGHGGERQETAPSPAFAGAAG